jgi:hypothetical protein
LSERLDHGLHVFQCTCLSHIVKVCGVKRFEGWFWLQDWVWEMQGNNQNSKLKDPKDLVLTQVFRNLDKWQRQLVKRSLWLGFDETCRNLQESEI